MPKTKTIAQLRRQLALQERRLARLTTRRGTLARQLRRVDREIASLAGGPAKPGPRRKDRKKVAKKKAKKKARKKIAKKAVRKTVKKATRRARERGGKPLAQYLTEVLSKTKAGMRARDLTAAVLNAGYVTRDKNFKQTVAATLGTDKRFKRVSRGVYKLA